MVCEKPTIMTFELGGIEAAFCPLHMPKEMPKIKITVVAKG